MKLTKSKNANDNYLAEVFQIKTLKKHDNADKLQICIHDYQEIITGMNAKEGDIYIYFPVESKISKEFLSYTNSFRIPELNSDSEQKGFFDENCRVRAARLRGKKSMGYIVPAQQLFNWVEDLTDPKDYIGTSFDTINGKLLVEKYIVKNQGGSLTNKYKGKKPQLSRLIDGQVHLHVNTANLRRNINAFPSWAPITITYKLHGTSFWVSNVLVKRKLNIIERALKFFGANIQENEYDYVYGSRRVVKNQGFEDPKMKDHFYGYDLWKDIRNKLDGKIPKGYTLYGEAVGYTKDGGFIQNGYDYGCEVGEFDIYIYRITFTNEDGIVFNLHSDDCVDFCKKYDLNFVPVLYSGTKEMFTETLISEYMYKNNKTSFEGDELEDLINQKFIELLEEKYNEEDCYMCTNEVPEEGIAIRVEKFDEFEAYKLKSFRFLEWEGNELDKGEVDMESEN